MEVGDSGGSPNPSRRHTNPPFLLSAAGEAVWLTAAAGTLLAARVALRHGGELLVDSGGNAAALLI